MRNMCACLTPNCYFVTCMCPCESPFKRGLSCDKLVFSVRFVASVSNGWCCRPGEGSLLPLWQFACAQGRKHVTSMCWSSLYADQFAVGYGSFHYHRQGTGAISIFSLKNPSHAELTITTTSGGDAARPSGRPYSTAAA